VHYTLSTLSISQKSFFVLTLSVLINHSILAHSTLIGGPIDSKPSANERELNFSRSLFARFPLKYRLREGAVLISAPLSTTNLATFLFKQLPAAFRSSYVSETNVVAKVTDSTVNRTPCIALAKPLEISRTFVFHPFLETTH
jgi:hypothetical protein